MSKILVLAESGFGKTTSIGPISKEVFESVGVANEGIKGLDPTKTFIICCSNKNLPIPGWKKLYTKTDADTFITTGKGNLVVTNEGDKIATTINLVNTRRSDIETILIDDANYVMQDYYMSKALTGGYDVFKKIGSFMGKIFAEMERVSSASKNMIVMAHFEEYKNSNLDTISFRFKTVGKMVQDYITPEGKFEIVLFGKQSTVTVDGKTMVKKEFVTNYDGQFPAKSPIGMFPLYIPNDLGYVLDCVKEYES